ncbi:IPT/TIG domain-containing protein [Arthrobacter sp. NPDC090010]|uniref:IPT/TIG domain-containing protein n=1 Tax=Arthrobacter sp. NPDC090010 TaxID=3363942 RepID=UPI0038249788
MANGTDAILTGTPLTATGGVCFNDPSGVMPTDATDALDSAFVKAGYIGEDGVVRTTDASDEKIKAWGGDVVKIVRTEHSIVYKFSFLESANADVLKLIHGAENVIITGQKIQINQTSKLPVRKAFVLDMRDGSMAIRELIKNGQITTSGDVTFVHSDVIKYEVTIEAFPDNAGVKAVSYIDQLTATAPTVTGATPSGAAAGSLITIKGAGFTGTTGATGVKIGGTNATSYTVVDDTTIVATIPAGSAGSVPIVVTSPAGASAAFSYTRGA